MKNLTLRHIAEVCGGTIHNFEQSMDQEVEGVVLDSRKAEPGFLFIAAKGERVDGHDFIRPVLEQGAVCIICEKPQTADIPHILVNDSFQALKDIAEYYRKQLSVKVVGITGSVGKTSTKEFVASVLSIKYRVLKTEGNYNNEVGLPLTILKIREEHEAAVLEMGISGFGEMHRLSKMARPDICVITNIGQCHLENLKSREGILKAKTEIFDFMNESGTVCVNGDDDMLASIEEIRGQKPVRFGIQESNRVYADSIVNQGLAGSSARIHMDDRSMDIKIPLPGDHMVYNALAAACVGTMCGLSPEEIAQGIAAVESVAGRSNIIRLNDKTIIDDCYNANPVSMCAALDLLSTMKTRKAAILGDMFELGEGEQELHKQVGGYAAEKKIDELIFIGKLSKYMYEGACREAQQKAIIDTHFYYYENQADFQANIQAILKKDDTILVKASHGMEFTRIVEKLKEVCLSEG